MELDEKDLMILDALKKNAKERLVKIAKRLNLPVSTIHNRIKKLEEEGVIRKYTIEIDYEKLGYKVQAIILIKYDPNFIRSQREILKEILKFEYVEEGSIITGEWDILIICKFRDIREMSNFILEKLRSIKGVKETYTMVILENESK